MLPCAKGCEAAVTTPNVAFAPAQTSKSQRSAGQHRMAIIAVDGRQEHEVAEEEHGELDRLGAQPFEIERRERGVRLRRS